MQLVHKAVFAWWHSWKPLWVHWAVCFRDSNSPWCQPRVLLCKMLYFDFSVLVSLRTLLSPLSFSFVWSRSISQFVWEECSFCKCFRCLSLMLLILKGTNKSSAGELSCSVTSFYEREIDIWTLPSFSSLAGKWGAAQWGFVKIHLIRYWS